MAKMINTKYGYVTPQEAEMDAHLDKWYKDKKRRANKHGAFSLKKNGGNNMPRTRRCRYPNCHAIVAFPDHYCQQHYEHEAEYLASRQRWARSNDKQYTHKYNTVTRYRNEDKRQQYNFYRTRQWSHLRQRVLERDHYLCAYCKVQGVITPAKTVDHIVPIEFDETLKANVDNLAVICGSCHRAKTDWEQSYYGTGQGNELQSVTPINDVSAIVVLMDKE